MDTSQLGEEDICGRDGGSFSSLMVENILVFW